jgi:hypothetical protein
MASVGGVSHQALQLGRAVVVGCYVVDAILFSIIVGLAAVLNPFAASRDNLAVLAALGLAIYAAPLLLGAALVLWRAGRGDYAVAAFMGLVPLLPFALARWSAEGPALVLLVAAWAIVLTGVGVAAWIAISYRRLA